MVVFMLERVTPSLRGELTRWLLELRPGVFVGQVSAMVRDGLWEEVCAGLERRRPKGGPHERGGEPSGAMLVYSTNTEQGFALRTHGHPTRRVVDFEGLSLVRVP